MAGILEDGGSYRVHCSGAIANKLKRLQKQATAEGRGHELLAAVRYALRRMSQDPTEFGEPVYHLPALRLQVRHAAVRPLLIDFAVSEDWLLVFIKGLELLAL